MRAWVGALGGDAGEVAAYQLGWTGDREPGRHGGKLVRAALTLLSARAMGGESEAAAPAAAAMEMVHNLSLLYDDVLDGDTVRRHRASAWQVFGAASATRAADALLVVAFEALADTGADAQVAREASAVLLDTLVQLAVGAGLDVLFEQRQWVEMSECLEMISGKTASLFGCSCRLGALYAGADSDVAAGFAAFGHDLGMAFQLVDDLLAIWGDPGVTGKPVHQDLLRRKMSVPVVAALTSATPAGQELARRYALAPGQDPVGECARLAELVEEAGGRRWTQVRVVRHVDAAREWLAQLARRGGSVEAAALEDLGVLCELMVTRAR
ncbi:polyprenyl synthetase family protein [Streptomyces sp. NPDC087658]|uniref:polyprenyl synthetase family protein n=1 Tax=Streptomyces sp. NPDC087658 TaxID=3365800 RepID=UPI003814BFE7